jgi:photosystem II stability/assembly factor-like uncharacterized protein
LGVLGLLVAACSGTAHDVDSSSKPTPVRRAGRLLIDDLTFVGRQGWALGTAACQSGRCPLLAHSSDNGLTWSRMPAPPIHVADLPRVGNPCREPCVAHIRFATDKVGYLYFGSEPGYARSDTWLMTTDGGTTWQREPGRADAIETLNGNVIRVVDAGGCPPGCRYALRTAAIGATTWHPIVLSGDQGQGDGVQLVRTGALSALETYGNPAGGGGRAQGTLFTSGDNGASWTRRGEPCPQNARSDRTSLARGEVDSAMITSAPDGSITVLCRPRDSAGWQFTSTSTDGGVTFHTGYRRALGGAPINALGASSARTILVSSDMTYRSTDAGRHFTRVAGPLAWLGFASSTVGHAISRDRHTVLTTTDAGRTWQAATIHQ